MACAEKASRFHQHIVDYKERWNLRHAVPPSRQGGCVKGEGPSSAVPQALMKAKYFSLEMSLQGCQNL